MHGQGDNRQSDRVTDRLVSGNVQTVAVHLRSIVMVKHSHLFCIWQIDKQQTGRLTNRHVASQTDRQTERWTNQLTDRHIHKPHKTLTVTTARHQTNALQNPVDVSILKQPSINKTTSICQHARYSIHTATLCPSSNL